MYRECLFFGKTYGNWQSLSPKVQVVGAPFLMGVSGKQRLRKRSLNCCLGTLIDPENIVSSSLASYVDEALLVVSVILAYMAGAVPHRATPGARHNVTDQNHLDSRSIPYGR